MIIINGNSSNVYIFITHKDNFNPNQAPLCVIIDNLEIPLDGSFERVLYFFDGKNPVSLQKAREEWRRVSSFGADKFYWQQDEAGKWKNKG